MVKELAFSKHVLFIRCARKLKTSQFRKEVPDEPLTWQTMIERICQYTVSTGSSELLEFDFILNFLSFVIDD